MSFNSSASTRKSSKVAFWSFRKRRRLSWSLNRSLNVLFGGESTRNRVPPLQALARSHPRPRRRKRGRTVSTFSSDIAYSDSPAASRASAAAQVAVRATRSACPESVEDDGEALVVEGHAACPYHARLH